MASRLHRPAARGLSEPWLSLGRRLASETAIGGASTRSWRCWREEGAQIVGGCCGVGPTLAAAREALADTKPGSGASRAARDATRRPQAHCRCRSPWKDSRGRPLFPLEFPDLARRGGHFRPRPRGASWSGSTCFARASAPTSAASTSAAARGCSRPARPQWGRARPRDRHRRSRRLEHPHERLPQRRRRSGQRGGRRPVPVGPRGALRRDRREPLPDAGRPLRAGSTHRPLDYWGRNLIDHLISLLPERWPTTASPTSCSSRSSASSARSSSSSVGLPVAGRRLRLLRFPRLFDEQVGADPPRRGALRRLPPEARRPGRDGRLPARGHPRAGRRNRVSLNA